MLIRRLANHSPIRSRCCARPNLCDLGVVHGHQSSRTSLHPQEPNHHRCFDLHVLSHVCYAWWNVSHILPQVKSSWTLTCQLPTSPFLSSWKEPFPREVWYRHHPLYAFCLCRYLCLRRFRHQIRSLLPLAHGWVSACQKAYIG
jgi:hypothetical protein